MKHLYITVLLSAIAYAVAERYPAAAESNKVTRIRRQADFSQPNIGPIKLDLSTPENNLGFLNRVRASSGSDGSLNLGYAHPLMDNGKTSVNWLSTVNLASGRQPSGSLGVGAKHDFNNRMFMTGSVVQPIPSPRFSPTASVGFGWTFR